MGPRFPSTCTTASTWDTIPVSVKSVETFVCPSDAAASCLKGGCPPLGTNWGAEWATVRLSYGYNYANETFSIGRIQYPSLTCAFAEMIERPYFYQHTLGLPDGGIGVGYNGNTRRLEGRHNDGMNLGFYDGHVSWVRYAQVFTTRANP